MKVRLRYLTSSDIGGRAEEDELEEEDDEEDEEGSDVDGGERRYLVSLTDSTTPSIIPLK